MWGFVNCSRHFSSFGVPKVVLHDASLLVQTTEKLGLLVGAGEGKSTIIKLLAGIDQPDAGHVLRDRNGWPLGYGGAFRAELSGEENINNVAALAGLDAPSYSAFCADFSELGEAYFHPLSLYTGRMRGRLAFAATFGIPASTYLADEKVAIGDDHFKKKCASALRERLKSCGLILVASNPRATKEFCDSHAVVLRGKIIRCESHDEAKAMFTAGMDEGAEDEIADEELASFDLA
jgi:capsular polysaccharide transport system ATP-binding protein